MAFLALLIAGALGFLVTMFGPEAMEAYRARKTEAALAQARDALLGYATTYRDSIDPNTVYGYLPLPDLGYSTPASNADRNNNIGCQHEGCDAGFAVRPAGSVAANYTVIGRFPWYLMGTEPIRDGYGECLWYAVSGSHKRTQPVTPMNWDTLGQLDVVIAKGEANLASILTSAHDRPVAIIFSAGQPLPGQVRSSSANQVVDECGGNYDVANYLDPDTVGALGNVANYFDASINNASDDTSDPANPKSFSTQGAVYRDSDADLWPKACPDGSDCALVGNDRGLTLSPDSLFGALRKSAGFRTDINSMLDRMVGCLRDYVATGGSAPPDAIPGYASPADKSAGRLPDYACYSAAPPLGYFNHWRDIFFVARPTAGNFNVTTDGVAQSCAGVLIFAGQRGPGQSRSDATKQSTLSNYLEGDNLASFTAVGTTFSGQSQFDIISATQPAQQDIIRCIPSSGSMNTTSPQNLVDNKGNPLSPLATYDPNSRTLTLGSEDATRGNGVAVSQLYGCAWTPEVNTRGNGFRAYFAFQFMGITGGLGNNGFVFAVIDGANNTTSVCGAAGSHLGYSGNNGATPPLTFPKIGVEFDLQRNAGFSESTNIAALNPGRWDPCGATPSGPPPPDCAPPYVGYNHHSAIVYWGHEQANFTDSVTRPLDDDNVHGYPSTGSQVANPRPAPQNPGASSPGVAFKDFSAKSDLDGDGQADSWPYHVRVEVTPTRNVNSSAAELSHTSFVTRVWIEHRDDSDPIIIAMKNTTRPMAQLNPIVPTLSDTATVYDVTEGEACNPVGTCGASGYTCGSDNLCYRPGLKSVRLGFTNSQRTQDQRVIISNFFASWLP